MVIRLYLVRLAAAALALLLTAAAFWAMRLPIALQRASSDSAAEVEEKF